MESGKYFIQIIDKCPVCGSKERFFEQMGNEMKLKGRLKPESGVYFEVKAGFVGDKAMLDRLPIGAEITKFRVCLDVCKCGLVYAVKKERVIVVKQPAQSESNLSLPQGN